MGKGASRQLSGKYATTIPGKNCVFAIKTAHDTYLCAGPGHYAMVNVQTYIDNWEKFTLVEVPGQKGKYAIKTHHNTYLRAEAGAGGKVNTQTYIGDWEKFEVLKVPGLDDVFALKTVHGTFINAKKRYKILWWYVKGEVLTFDYRPQPWEWYINEEEDWTAFKFEIGV